jgi:Methyltransferase domain
VHASIEEMDDAVFNSLFPSDCWVFADTLEHLRDPWEVLRRIRGKIASGGCVVACIPNAQHWSVQVKLNSGLFRYEDSGLLDRTHLRWFTRITIGEMFESTGFRIVEGGGRIIGQPSEGVLSAIRGMAYCSDSDPERAATDAIPFQWVVRAEPK